MRQIPKVMLLIENSREYGRGLLRGIARYSRLHGPWLFYHEMPFYVGSDIKEPNLARIKSLELDGIIMRDVEQTQKIIKLNLPTIISDFKEKPLNSHIIVTDDIVIGEMAAEYFLNKGFKRFAFCGFDKFFWSRERALGFEKTVAKAGFETHFYKLPEGSLKGSDEIKIIAEWLISLPKHVALAACNDDRARHVILACKVAGLLVPYQVAVIGADNDELVCELTTPPLTSIALNTEGGGFEAARLLDKLMAGEIKKPQTIIVRPTHIVTRLSTDILAIDDTEVGKAIRYIRSRAREKVWVSDVANSVAISRRELERRFRRIIGRSIHSEIRRIRVEEIAAMLSETNLSISHIAINLGFSGIEHIARYFKKEKGVAPLIYRKKYGKKAQTIEDIVNNKKNSKPRKL